MIKRMKSRTRIISYSKVCLKSLLMAGFLNAEICKAESPLLDAFLQGAGRDVLINVMSEWVKPKEVVLLDTAVCNEKLQYLWRESVVKPALQSELVIKDGISLPELSQLRSKFPNVKRIVFPLRKLPQSILPADFKDFVKELFHESLDHLDLSNCNLTDGNLEIILNICQNIKTLNLSGNSQLSVKVLSKVKTEKLEEINLSNCIGMNGAKARYVKWNGQPTDEAIRERRLAQHNLMKERNRLDMKKISSFLESCLKLKKLDISSHRGATEEIFRSIKLHELKELLLPNASGMTDEAMRLILGCCGNIKRLE